MVGTAPRHMLDKSNGDKSNQTLERSDESSDAEGRQNHASPDACALPVWSPRSRLHV